MVKELGVPRAKKESYQLTEYNSDRASQLLKNYEDNDNTFVLLTLLADFELISFDFLFRIVDESKFMPILNELISQNMVELNGAEGEFIRLIEPIRDYLNRLRARQKQNFMPMDFQ